MHHRSDSPVPGTRSQRYNLTSVAHSCWLAGYLLLAAIDASPAVAQISGSSGYSDHSRRSGASDGSIHSWSSPLSPRDSSVVTVNRSLHLSATSAVMISVVNRVASGLPWEDASRELGPMSRTCGGILAAFSTDASHAMESVTRASLDRIRHELRAGSL